MISAIATGAAICKRNRMVAEADISQYKVGLLATIEYCMVTARMSRLVIAIHVKFHHATMPYSRHNAALIRARHPMRLIYFTVTTAA